MLRCQLNAYWPSKIWRKSSRVADSTLLSLKVGQISLISLLKRLSFKELNRKIWKKGIIGTLGIPRDSKKGMIGIPRDSKKRIIGSPRDSKKGIIGSLGIPGDFKKGILEIP